MATDIEINPASLSSHQRAQLANAVQKEEKARRKTTIVTDIKARIKDFEDRHDWSPFRLKLVTFFESIWYDAIVFILLGVNIILVIQETDDRAKCLMEPDGCSINAVLDNLNLLVIAVFVFEVAVKIYVYRMSFWINQWNIFDFTLICLSAVVEFLGSIYPSLSILRLVRLCRLGRMLHIMVDFQPLYLIVTGFISAMQSLFWACLLLSLATSAWSVVVVILLHPITRELGDAGIYDGCHKCQHAFSSVMRANLTLLQTVIMGDDWGEICIPIIEHSPWTAIIFCGIIATVDLCICNLILATIVHSAEEARNDDMKFILRTRKACEDQQRRRLAELCAELDADHSGTLTHDELSEGYASNAQFTAVFQSMNLSIEDVKSVLFIADQDGNGDVDYMEFIDLILQLKSTDPKSILMLMRRDLSYIKDLLRDDGDDVRNLLQSNAAKRPTKAARLTKRCSLFRRGETWPSSSSEQLKAKRPSARRDASVTAQQDEPEPVPAAHETIHIELSEWEPLPCCIPAEPIEPEPILSSPPSRIEDFPAPETRYAIPRPPFTETACTQREPYGTESTAETAFVVDSQH